MTVDARCWIATDLGIAKDGSGLSEDHAQGLGLITYRGTFIFDGILTPARGRVIQVAYARPQYGASGLLTRFYPRLQVISSSADPFANETTVEVGCQLELMRERKDPVQYRAIDHPPDWWTALSPARQKEVPPVVEVQGVIEFCLDALGIPLAAGSATTDDVKVVEAIDLSGGYVQALDDMLRSSLLIGHITPAGELLVQPVDLAPAPGPVLRRQNLLTLRPINDRGGAEQVVVEFDAIEAPANLTPEQLTEEQRQQRDWELDVVIGAPETHTLVFYGVKITTGAGGSSYEVDYDARFTRLYQTVQSSYTRTNYQTFTWVDQDGQPQSTDLAINKTRTVIVTGSPGYGRGDQFYYPNTGSAPAGSQETTTYQYEITADGPVLVTEETVSRQESRGYTSILPTYYLPEGSLSLEREVSTSRVVVHNEVDEEAGLTKRTTTRYNAVAKTQAGSQAMFHLFDRVNSRDQYDQAVEAGTTETMVGVEVQIGIGRQFGVQSRPSAQARMKASQLSRFRDDASLTSSGTVGSSIGQEEPQIVTASYSFGGAGTEVWNTSNLRLPYAPDDFITASGTVDLLLTRGRARQRALEYGRIQNALDFGHANGVEITTAPWELPSPPLAAVYIEESGVSTAFRTNGRNWEIRNGAIIVTADLCLVGTAGRLIGETPVSWTPQPADPADLPELGAPSGSGELLPANTITLPSGFDPAAPGAVWSSLPNDETDSYGPSRSPGSIAPPYVQAVQILAKSRAVAITTELLYSLTPITETIEAVSRSKAFLYPVASTASLALTAPVPLVEGTDGAFVIAPLADMTLSAPAPVVEGTTDPVGVDAPTGEAFLTADVPFVYGSAGTDGTIEVFPGEAGFNADPPAVVGS